MILRASSSLAWIILALALLVLPAPDARAQFSAPTPCPGTGIVCSFRGGIVVGPASGGYKGVGTINAAAIYQNGVPFTATAGGSVGQVQVNAGGTLAGSLLTAGSAITTTTGSLLDNEASYPSVAFGQSYRSHFIANNITVTGSTSGVDENFFVETHTLGTGTYTSEINIIHSYFQNDTATLNNSTEAFEASMFNTAIMSQATDYLALINNGGASSTIGVAVGVQTGLSNTNTAAGSVGQWMGISCKALTGGGAVPPNNYCVNNTDATQAISTAGRVSIGNPGMPPSNVWLLISGPDTSTTYAMYARDVNNRLIFAVQDNGNAYVGNTLAVGTPGTTGLIQLYNSTSGSITLQTANGALGNVLATFPANNGNIAELNFAQSWTARQQFVGVDNANYTPNMVWQNSSLTSLMALGDGGFLAVGVSLASTAAALTLGDIGGAATYGNHFATLQTTAPAITAGGTLDAKATDDAGLVTGGTASTGFVITFNKAYFSTPHCLVTPRGGSSTITSYTCNLSTLTVVTPSQTGALFDYWIVQ